METTSRYSMHSITQDKTTPVSPNFIEAFTPKTQKQVHVVVVPQKIPFFIRVLGIIFSVLIMLNGIWSFLMIYYVTEDKGNKEAYFPPADRELTIYEGLRIRILYLKMLPEESAPILITDDNGWYERTHVNMEKGVDKGRLTNINGYTYLKVSSYFLLIL